MKEEVGARRIYTIGTILACFFFFSQHCVGVVNVFHISRVPYDLTVLGWVVNVRTYNRTKVPAMKKHVFMAK